MNADEIVRALRCVQEKHRNDRLLTFQTDVSAMARDAADMIESLQAELTASQRRGKAAVGDKCDRFFIDDGGQCLAPSCWNENRTDYQICVKCGGDKAKCCLSDRHT